MTSPDGATGGIGSLAEFAAKSADDWLAEMRQPQEIAWGDGGFLSAVFQGVARGKPFSAAVLEAIVKPIWDGTGGLGDTIAGIFDPSHAQQAMEETQRRIAAAVAQIIAIGGTTVNFGELPPGPNLPGWHRSHIAGTGGSLIVQDGQLRIVGDVGIGGTRWRAILTEKVPTQADVRVDAVFGSAPGFLSGSANRIIARSDDGDNYAFARLLSARGDLGVCVNGQETILKSSGMTFSPAVPYALVAHGSTLELRRDGQLIGEPAVDSRVGALTGRLVGAEFFSALTIDQCGGLAALGFRNYTAVL